MKPRHLDIDELFFIMRNFMLYTQQPNDYYGTFTVCDISKKAVQDFFELKSASNGYMTVSDNVISYNFGPSIKGSEKMTLAQRAIFSVIFRQKEKFNGRYSGANKAKICKTNARR